MSTKIFNGYRITNPAGGRPDPFLVADQLRAALAPVHRDVFADLVAHLATGIVDTRRHLPQLAQESMTGLDAFAARPAYRAWEIIDELREQGRKQRRRTPGVDFSCDVAFLADPADRDGPLYARMYTEVPQYLAVFASLPGVEPFAYHNTSDRPADLGEAEWEHRRQVWDRVCGDDVPAVRGLVWTLHGDTDVLMPWHVKSELAAHIPDADTRARDLAAQMAAAEKAERAAGPDASAPARQVGAAQLLREQRAADTARLTRARQLLEPVTVDDLLGVLPHPAPSGPQPLG